MCFCILNMFNLKPLTDKSLKQIIRFVNTLVAYMLSDKLLQES
jgi:hypothetical protein